MARPVPGRPEKGDRGHPRRLSETNGMHGASGYRVRMDAEYATPLAGPTYRAQTRYRLAGPRSAGEKLPAGTWDRPAVPRWNPRPSGRGGCQILRIIRSSITLTNQITITGRGSLCAPVGSAANTIVVSRTIYSRLASDWPATGRWPRRRRGELH